MSNPKFRFPLDEITALSRELDYFGVSWPVVDVIEELLDSLGRALDFSFNLVCEFVREACV